MSTAFRHRNGNVLHLTATMPYPARAGDVLRMALCGRLYLDADCVAPYPEDEATCRECWAKVAFRAAREGTE